MRPYAGLIFDNAGNLYGSASCGGKNQIGTVLEVIRSGDSSIFNCYIRSESLSPSRWTKREISTALKAEDYSGMGRFPRRVRSRDSGSTPTFTTSMVSMVTFPGAGCR